MILCLKCMLSGGVDFIKCDDICNTNIYPHNHILHLMRLKCLQRQSKKCGRSVVLSLSPGPALIEKAWHYENNANMWRITDDFWDELEAFEKHV